LAAYRHGLKQGSPLSCLMANIMILMKHKVWMMSSIRRQTPQPRQGFMMDTNLVTGTKNGMGKRCQLLLHDTVMTTTNTMQLRLMMHHS